MGMVRDFGPLPLFAITPQFPRGAYALSCRVLDPVTGKIHVEDFNSFVVQ
jgi:hypothetical protein